MVAFLASDGGAYINGTTVFVDGGLTLLLQHERPGADANWLPAPPGRFVVALRDRMGSGVDIGIDFHGAVEPPTAKAPMR